MTLGYEVEEEKRSFEQKGITGSVTRYVSGSLDFPCFIVKAPFEQYKIRVLSTMFQKVDSYSEYESNLAINLYFESTDGRLAGLGKIYPRQVNSFLKLFSTNKVSGFYEDGTELQGDYLYVLGG